MGHFALITTCVTLLERGRTSKYWRV